MTSSSSSLPLSRTPPHVDRFEHYQKKLAHYTNPGADRVKRHWEFLVSSHSNMVYYGSAGATCIVTGVFLGVTAGLKVSDNNKVVGAAGGVGGGIAGVVTYMTITERKQAYKDWINVKMDDLIESSMFEKYSDDDILENFVCPVYQGVATIPTRTPNGRLMDLNTMMKCPQDANGNIIDPMRSEPAFPTASLELDHEAALLINKRIFKLLSVDIETAKGNPELVSSLKRQVEKTQKCINTCYTLCLTRIDHELIQGKISFDQAQKQRQLFADRFGSTPEQELDWTIDWKGILDNRWKADNS